MAVVLPQTKSEVDNRFSSQKFGMIGQAGIGKSSFWSHGNGLYIQTEAGLNHLSVFKLPCHSWEDFRDIVGELLKRKAEGKLPYEFVMIDTIDKLVDFANQEAVSRGKEKFKAIEINTVGDIPNGAGWAWAQDLVEMGLNKLEQLGCAVGYIGHLENKEVKEPTRSIHKLTISIGGKMGGLLTAWPDHLMSIQATYAGNDLKRVVRTLPSQTLEAKSRGGLVPDMWQLDSDMAKNWAKFRSYFK